MAHKVFTIKADPTKNEVKRENDSEPTQDKVLELIVRFP